MGIKGLARLIADAAPAAIKEVELKTYFGRRIAIDASMSLYQFLVAIRHSNQQMTNDAGEATSHLIGFFYRTCKLLEVGIKPIYVFDGKAPVLKGGELAKRKERREDANKKLEEASGADIEKYSKRLVRVTRKHNDDVKTLLRLMGLADC
ncbi:Flap endonuclease 1 [Halotydeus destructor]|nr:Flap endonuclease 1 [Halotydeus destructor]